MAICKKRLTSTMLTIQVCAKAKTLTKANKAADFAVEWDDIWNTKSLARMKAVTIPVR